MNALTYFAAETQGSKPGLFEALGIDWKLLILQIVAFLVLVWALRKFVYPVLIKSIDERQATIDKSLQDAKATHDALEQAETRVDELLANARKEADGIVSRSQQEAAAMVAEAEERARERSERIVADARVQIDADISAARRALKQETAKLVAQATGALLHEKVDSTKDAQLIERALARESA
jgi:F-type H+-transporting ATPase subunit b